jgi:23S rRNA maturation-related 3'-5' exoribonuclease YhaM
MVLTLDDLDRRYAELFELLGGRREQVLRFKQFLERQTCWLTAPASTRFHLNFERGLLLHSVGVTLKALDVKRLLAKDITDELIGITALLHDLDKVGCSR